MRPDQKSYAVLALGAVVVTLICILQGYTDLVHGTVYVLIVGFSLLWLLRNYRSLYDYIGILVTAGIVAGYLVGHEHGPGPLINRVFSVFIFWLLVRFTIRYSRISNKERRNRQQLDALFNNVSEAILLVDEDGKIIMVNPGAVRVFGYQRDELEVMKIEMLIPERFSDGHEQYRLDLKGNIENLQIGTGKCMTGLRKDGSEFPLELGLSSYNDNATRYIIAFVTDITKRKHQEAQILSQYRELEEHSVRLEEEVKARTAELTKALDSVQRTNENLSREIGERMEIEDRLRKSQLLYKAVARNFPDGIIAILNNEMKFVFVEGRELGGTHLKGSEGSAGVFDGLHRIVLSNHSKEIRKAFEGDRVNLELEADGKYYDVIATPLRDADRPAREVLVVIRNVTRYKKYEQGLQQALEKEKQLNVLKSTFVSNVSHEFRTPLTTILSSVFLIENYNKDNAEAQRKNYLARIRRSVNLLTEMLEDFLSLEKLSEGKVQVECDSFTLDEFFDDLVAEFEGIRKGGQQITFSIEGESKVVTDRSILSNILNNLLSNAIKYSPDDGKISIKGCVHGSLLRLTVSDNGMGIPPEERHHIFDRFYRAPNAANIQGTGLGLNLVRKYVTLLHGTIYFESVVDQGSTFVVELPLGNVCYNPAVLVTEMEAPPVG